MGVEQRFDVEGLPPRRVDPDHRRPEPTCNVAHPLAEQPVHSDDDDVAGVDDVHERSLHPGRTGTAHRQCQPVGGDEHRSQPVVHLVEDLQELGVEMSEKRLAKAAITSG